MRVHPASVCKVHRFAAAVARKRRALWCATFVWCLSLPLLVARQPSTHLEKLRAQLAKLHSWAKDCETRANQNEEEGGERERETEREKERNK